MYQRLLISNYVHKQDVRNEHKVDVNMRIGVHSGYILSGIIGKTKFVKASNITYIVPYSIVKR